MIKLTITKEHGAFVVDNKAWSGSPPIGRGRTMLEAIGAWLQNNQEDMGIDFVLEGSVLQTEERRRQRELSKR